MLTARLERRFHMKEAGTLPPGEKVVHFVNLWDRVKKSAVRDGNNADTWCDLIFPRSDQCNPAAAKEALKLRMPYFQLIRERDVGRDWCRKSAVTGPIPYFIVAEIRGKNWADVPVVTIDPGLVNMVAFGIRGVGPDVSRLRFGRLTGSLAGASERL